MPQKDLYKRNIKYLREKANITNIELAEFLGCSLENIKQILYSNGKMTLINKKMLCNIFEISLSQLENCDLAARDDSAPIPNILNKKSIELIDIGKKYQILEHFLIILDESSINDEEYLICLANLKEIINLEDKNCTFVELEQILQNFLSTFERTKRPEVCINCLSLILFLWISIHSYVNNPQDKVVQNNQYRASDEERSIDSPEKTEIYKKESEFIDKYYYKTIDLLNELHSFEKYQDFISYYIAIKMYNNFLDKDIEKRDNEEARSFGLTLLYELYLTGNKYAKRLEVIFSNLSK